ncbi:hypothetical protein GXW83_27410 [Streptacidiphilus sp. PB12-B1b]|uniref:DUF6907 domain-containing protein n=1 Tax=Streptacidiphilus sp. PB12-B1b TaxID=2705012 RepID=UPI0015FA579B|nr:hypothetical protein [Streptacidiphilus sp. PB12-B1b]QMU78874.1 hypothetical protein GXW83_27410 [Streptacidiphilus sp. PB12-B1b]
MTDPHPDADSCPPWCCGSHGDQPTWHGIEFHESRPVVLDVLTGPVKLQCVTAMTQYPKARTPAGSRVFAWSHITADVTMARPSDLRGFADMLSGYAARLREVADELGVAQAQDRERERERTQAVETDARDAGREE